MTGEFVPMRVKEIRRETADTVSILLESMSGQGAVPAYKPGQYLTLRWKIKDQEYRRSYSISSIPTDEYITVTVKEVEQGVVSPQLNRYLKAGDVLDVMGPEGRFTTSFDPDQKRTIFLIGAGSGITPLMSLLRTALEHEPKSTIVLIYGSRAEDQIIFKPALDSIEQKYKGQVYVYHTLSQPDGEGGLIKSLFGKKKSSWQGLKGRIQGKLLKEVFEKHPVIKQNAIYFICGPGDLIEMAEKVILSSGAGETQIKKEYFLPPSSAEPLHQNEIKTKMAGQTSKVIVHLRGDTIEANVTDKSILDTLLDMGYDAPYSCHSGACATCMAKVLQGKVEMDACFALSDQEVENGYILSCQSHPTTEFVEITYDE